MSKEITITTDYLEHLLNCLANQKFLHEMSDTVRDHTGELMKAPTQKIIDDAWVKGMDMLCGKAQQQTGGAV